jgi:hypothetical protein
LFVESIKILFSYFCDSSLSLSLNMLKKFAFSDVF